jgi:hypothetical protein
MRSKVTYWLAILLFAVAAVWWGVILIRQYGERQIKRIATAPTDVPPREYGSTSAKVQIQSSIPMGAGCQAAGLQLLTKLAKEEPERVHVVIYDIHSKAAREAGMAGCSSIEVNGQTQFKVQRGGREVDVVFRQAPDERGSGFHSTDLVRVADAELRRAYGSGLKADGVLATLDEVDREIDAGLARPETLAKPIQQFGPASAPVHVVAYWPLGQASSPQFLAGVGRLRSLSGEYGDGLSIELVRADSAEGQKRAGADKVQPPAVLINGSPTHTFNEDGKERTVTFYGTTGLPEAGDDTDSDVEAAIREVADAAAKSPAAK